MWQAAAGCGAAAVHSQRAAARALLTQGSGFLPVGYGFVRFSAAVPYPPTACAKNPGLSRDAIPSLPLPRTCHAKLGSSRTSTSVRRLGLNSLGCETSAVRVARRRRTDMVMQASMWVLGVAAVERRSVVGMRGTETAVGARELSGNLRGTARRPTAIPSLPPRKHSPSLAARQAPPIPSHVF